MTASRPDRIAEGATALGVALSRSQVASLHRYLDLLEKWNAAYNLTAVRGREAMEVEHVLDSLAVLPHLPDDGLVLDVGTGAGLPGMVLAIARPAQQVVLLDSNGKKTRFLRQAVAELGLANVMVRQARIEAVDDLVPATVISRAFATLPDMAQACAGLLAGGARLLAMKGARPDGEIAALPGTVQAVAVNRIMVPFLDKERHLVCIRHDTWVSRTTE